MESGAADSHRAAVHSGAAQRPESRRSTGERRGRAVEGERGGGDPERPRVDAALCDVGGLDRGGGGESEFWRTKKDSEEQQKYWGKNTKQQKEGTFYKQKRKENA